MSASVPESEPPEWARINALPDYHVFRELQEILGGSKYSWHTINQKIQAQVDDEIFVNEFYLQLWNFLCQERGKWEHMQRQSFVCPRYNRGYLLSLKTIPLLIGLRMSPSSSEK